LVQGGIPSPQQDHGSGLFVNKLLHNVPEPAQSTNIIPTLANNSLMSTSKFADARYTVVYSDNEVNNYKKATTKIIV
jgi:hypothetical protein